MGFETALSHARVSCSDAQQELTAGQQRGDGLPLVSIKESYTKMQAKCLRALA
jgi:hypothetical protein